MYLVVLTFLRVRSYKHTIYWATKLVFPYVFFFVFRIIRSRTIWVTVIFKCFTYCFLYCVWNIFSFGFIKAFDSKQRTCKDVQGLRHQQGLWCVKYIFFGFIEALDLKGILNSLKEGITSAMQYADETVFTFARVMVQIKQFVLIKWCGVCSNQIIIKDSFGMCSAYRLWC